MNGVLGQYLRLQFRTFCHTWKKICIFLLCVLLAAGAVLGALYLRLRQPQDEPPVQAALVIPGEQDEIQMLSKLSLLAESVRNTVHFVYPDETQAREMLADGEVQAVILLGEDFYSDVDSGVNTPVTILVPENPSEGLQMFLELLLDGIWYIDSVEATSYAVLDVYRERNRANVWKEAGTYIMNRSLSYMAEVRGDVQNTIIAATGEYSMAEYYVSTALLWYLLICGIGFYGLYEDRDPMRDRRLALYGVGRAVRTAVRLLFLWTGLLILLLAGMFAAAAVGELSGAYIVQPDGAMIVRLMFPAAVLSCICHGCLSVADYSKSGRRILILVFLTFLLAGGCVVPDAYLPRAVSAAGAFSPARLLREAVTGILFGMPEDVPLLPLAVCSVCFLLAGVLWEVWADRQPLAGKAEPVQWKALWNRLFLTEGSRLLCIRLYLKWLWKRKSPVAELFLAVLAVTLIGSIRLPGQNRTVLVYGDGAETLLEEACPLLEQSVFTWEYADSEDAAKAAVQSGRALAAVAETEDGACVNTASYFRNQMVAEETYAAARFLTGQPRIIMEVCENYFADEKEAVHREAIEAFQKYIQSEELFRVDIQTEESTKKEEE